MQFTNEEIEILKTCIQQRIESLSKAQNDEFIANDKHYKVLLNLISNLENNLRLPQNQQSILRGIAKDEMFKPIDKIHKKIENCNDIELLHLTTQSNELDYLFLVESLYNKIHKKIGAIKLSKDTLEPFYLLNSLPYSKVAYSILHGKVYKIGIPIDSKYLIAIELDSNEKCIPFNICEISKSKNSFMHIGSHKVVLNLFDEYDKEQPLTRRMLFVQEILKINLS